MDSKTVEDNTDFFYKHFQKHTPIHAAMSVQIDDGHLFLFHDGERLNFYN